MGRGLKIQQPLKALLTKTNNNPETVKTIRSCALIYRMVKKGKETKRAIDCDFIDMIKKRYAGLSFEQLLLLWHENYHSSEAIKEEVNNEKQQDNVCSVLLHNKVIAIGMLLHEKY